MTYTQNARQSYEMTVATSVLVESFQQQTVLVRSDQGALRCFILAIIAALQCTLQHGRAARRDGSSCTRPS